MLLATRAGCGGISKKQYSITVRKGLDALDLDFMVCHNFLHSIAKKAAVFINILPPIHDIVL
jgi:hypothetical protein